MAERLPLLVSGTTNTSTTSIGQNAKVSAVVDSSALPSSVPTSSSSLISSTEPSSTIMGQAMLDAQNVLERMRAKAFATISASNSTDTSISTTTKDDITT